jgi:hypothetical protein
LENSTQPTDQQLNCVIPIHKPNLREYIFFFASGIVVSIPFAVFYETLFPTSAWLLVVVLAPFIEELAKVFPLFYRHGETERSIVTFGLLLGLGFGIAELVEYVAFNDVPFLVRLPGVIFHASSAIIVAYGVAKKNPLPFYLMAVLLHVVNNFFAFSADIYGVLVELIIIIVTYGLAWRLWNRTRPDVMIV